ncbi:regulatory signaling modulator protein AmpE [Aquicella lusitana]|uniref:Membrane protein required for beta-lactamase induction n=1 Tax=Aquicella lusitana TaxID=254246 RepID=A0A370G3W7_9COXI|nr:regulatory signaling modulator protein AmpE [Aquicella lusitana]RDI38452.1 membrane protein required for beta-lactamase induction [Aquicella lusitana]VVC73761.1 hypothetical protein AQULUS_15100 [Aquicella lusitana]
MTFIVILIALLIERFFDWSHLRQWSWYHRYENLISERLPGKSPYLTLLLTILPLLIVIAIIDISLKGWLYGFIRLLFHLFILLYCLGPQNLWADAFSCINALTQGDAHFAADKLKTSFGITDTSYSQSLHQHLLNNIFVEANTRVFAIVFWYLILGPVGAVLYRTVALSSSEMPREDMTPTLSQTARLIKAVLDWVPVRLFTFIFALGGHFVHVLSCWQKKVLQGLSSSEALLTECGQAALGNEEQGKIPEDGSAERAAIHLLDRVFVIVLVIVALIAWVV